jgi:hypothetical protein
MRSLDELSVTDDGQGGENTNDDDDDHHLDESEPT